MGIKLEGRSQAISAANDKRHQVVPSRVIWDGSIDRFEVFRNSIEGHYGQIGATYFFDAGFQTAYLQENLFYLVKRLVMMMILGNGVRFRMLKILAWLILF
jgi:hypothetical protein